MANRIIDAYAQVYDNLRRHDARFPEPSYLRSISVLGQRGYGMSDVGAGRSSPGSSLLIRVVDEPDTRPVWFLCWGGCNTAAQALWEVRQNRSAAELERFVSKLRVYDVLGQDNAGTWIAKTFPKLLYIRATGVYGWQPSDGWLDSHVQNHGPLGAVYPDRKWATEGDTPSFLHVIANGLNDPDQVAQGGWGGRFDPVKKRGIRGMSCMQGEDAVYDPYEMYGNSSEGAGAISRWRPAYDNDFAARMDWTVTSEYSQANHHPRAVVNGDDSKRVLYLTAAAGSTVTLNAEGSSDPDGDALTYGWSYYREASDYDGTVSISGANAVVANVNVPAYARGRSLHVILTVRDDGAPNLYAYRRVVITVQ
ncbi:MAG: hypothetical protein KatS3mg121_0118 [Gammaproteobacteria bacterium]|nr:MAG: hypothetical protein KatS3mg121_0118 [Gammaproteobacteria bacterium]